MYELGLSPQAQRFFKRCDRPLALKLARCFTTLEQDPRRGNNIKPLAGKFSGSYRYRVGDYRVVYAVDDNAMKITVLTIAHRKDVYE
jgi:mRNA interferase RelE/StbE